MSKGINIPEYEVSQFNRLFKEVVEQNFEYVRIRGEISELKSPSSGHLYLTLKDDVSVLNATIWNQKKNLLKIKPEIGMDVIVTGKISTYAKSISTYSINIDNLELAGEGALLKLIQDRKIRLEKKGIFDKQNKKNLPYLPSKIGVITSPTGSVIYDIINRVSDRFPIKIDIWPVSVQGNNASNEIIDAIKGFNSDLLHNKPEVIIIARGGGSTEDLMPFNDEKLAIAVYESAIPIVSAIGHETDTTIIDYCSDFRASTPTAAVEKVVPIRLDLIQIIFNISNRLNYLQMNKLNNFKSEINNFSKLLKAPNFIIISYKDKLNLVSKNLKGKLEKIYKEKYNELKNNYKLLQSPENDFINLKNNLNHINKNINKIINNQQSLQKKEVNKLSRLLKSNSINTNLKKGYTIIKKSKKIIRRSNDIAKEDAIAIQFSDKAIKVSIKKIN